MYLKETKSFSKAYYKDVTLEITSVRSELNHQARKHLFSIESYKKSIRKILCFKNKIPLYFSKKLFLFYLKTTNDEVYYINLQEVLKLCYIEKNIVVIFTCGRVLKLDTSINSVKTTLKKADIISNYIYNL